MMELDTSKWKKFKIGDLFSIKRGTRIVRDVDYFEQKNDEFKYPVITSTTLNNSVDGYYTDFNCEGNVICSGGEAGALFSTYQKNRCWVMDRSRILKPKFQGFNQNLAMFFIPILNANRYLFTYSRTPNPSIIEELIIKLPATPNGDPDWEWMENYIKSLLEREREREFWTCSEISKYKHTSSWY